MICSRKEFKVHGDKIHLSLYAAKCIVTEISMMLITIYNKLLAIPCMHEYVLYTIATITMVKLRHIGTGVSCPH